VHHTLATLNTLHYIKNDTSLDVLDAKKNDALINLKTILDEYPNLKARILTGPTDEDKINKILACFDKIKTSKNTKDGKCLDDVLRNDYATMKLEEYTSDPVAICRYLADIDRPQHDSRDYKTLFGAINRIYSLSGDENKDKVEQLKTFSPACCIACILFPEFDTTLITQNKTQLDDALKQALYVTAQNITDIQLWHNLFSTYYGNDEHIAQELDQFTNYIQARKIAQSIQYFGQNYGSTITPETILTKANNDRLKEVYEFIKKHPESKSILLSLPEVASTESRKNAAAHYYIKKPYSTLTPALKEYLDKHIDELIPSTIPASYINGYIEKTTKHWLEPFPIHLPESETRQEFKLLSLQATAAPKDTAAPREVAADTEAPEDTVPIATPERIVTTATTEATPVVQEHTPNDNQTAVQQYDNQTAVQQYDNQTAVQQYKKDELYKDQLYKKDIIDRQEFCYGLAGWAGITSMGSIIALVIFYRRQQAIIAKMRTISGDPDIIKNMEANEALYSEDLENLYDEYQLTKKKIVKTIIVGIASGALTVPLVMKVRNYETRLSRLL